MILTYILQIAAFCRIILARGPKTIKEATIYEENSNKSFNIVHNIKMVVRGDIVCLHNYITRALEPKTYIVILEGEKNDTIC